MNVTKASSTQRCLKRISSCVRSVSHRTGRPSSVGFQSSAAGSHVSHEMKRQSQIGCAWNSTLIHAIHAHHTNNKQRHFWSACLIASNANPANDTNPPINCRRTNDPLGIRNFNEFQHDKWSLSLRINCNRGNASRINNATTASAAFSPKDRRQTKRENKVRRVGSVGSLGSHSSLSSRGHGANSPNPNQYLHRQRGIRGILQSQHSRKPRQFQIRRIVTSCIEPPLDPTIMERPETIVLCESALYQHDSRHNPHNNLSYLGLSGMGESWKDQFANFFPRRGLQFASLDLMKPMKRSSGPPESDLTIANLEKTLANDLSNLSNLNSSTSFTDNFDALQMASFASSSSSGTLSSAHAVLIARGPIPSLIAQYYLESLPLAGLVLVDPLLLPPLPSPFHPTYAEGSNMSNEGDETNKLDLQQLQQCRWNSSLRDWILMLEGRAPSLYNRYDRATSATNATNGISSEIETNDSEDGADGTDCADFDLASLESLESDPELDGLDASCKNELAFLRSLSIGEKMRPLRLEPNSVPMLVLYSDHEVYSDHFRVCAERTAAFHSYHDVHGGSRVGDRLHGVHGVDRVDKVHEAMAHDQQVMVMRIPKVEGDGMDGNGSKGGEQWKREDVDWVMNCIYEWYDDVVS